MSAWAAWGAVYAARYCPGAQWLAATGGAEQTGTRGRAQDTYNQTEVALGEVDHGRVEVGALVKGRDDDGDGQGRRDLCACEQRVSAQVARKLLGADGESPGAKQLLRTYPGVPS